MASKKVMSRFPTTCTSRRNEQLVLYVPLASASPNRWPRCGTARSSFGQGKSTVCCWFNRITTAAQTEGCVSRLPHFYLINHQEWCEISVKDLVVATDETGAKKDRRTNFFFVASRASSHHLAYYRDLPLLLTLSMEIKEHSLALDLGTSPMTSQGRKLFIKSNPLSPLWLSILFLQPVRLLRIQSFQCKILLLILS